MLERRCLLIATISVSVDAAAEVAEDPSESIVFTLTRDDTTEALSVPFELSGDAIYELDYTVGEGDRDTVFLPDEASGGTVVGGATFYPGESTVEIIVRPRGDAIVEPDEDVTLTVPAFEPFGTVQGAASLVRSGEPTEYFVVDNQNRLGTVDPLTGVVDVIGQIDAAAGITDLTFIEDGTLFAISANVLYEVDPDDVAAGIIATRSLGAHGIPAANALVAARDGDFNSETGDLLAVGSSALILRGIDLERIGGQWSLVNTVNLFDIRGALQANLFPSNFISSGDLDYFSDDRLVLSAAGFDEFSVPQPYDSLIEIETPGSGALIDRIPRAAEDIGEDFRLIFGLAFDGNDSYAFSGHLMLSVNQFTRNVSRHLEMTGRPYLLGSSDTATGTILGADWQDTIGLYQGDISLFHLKESFSPGLSDLYSAFGPGGSAGWTPLSGDWNGDGVDTIGLYQPDISLFHLKDSFAPGGSDRYFAFGPGGGGWIPLAGDWNGDGVDTIGLYQPDISLFHLKDSFTPGVADHYFAFGPPAAGWIPLVGDWDGDGADSVGLYQPDISLFHLKDSFTPGLSDHYFAFGPGGGAGWTPLSGDWNGDGVDTIGLYQPDISLFHLKDTFTPGAADQYFAFGPGGAGWIPLVGDWNGPSTSSPTALRASRSMSAAAGLPLDGSPEDDDEVLQARDQLFGLW